MIKKYLLLILICLLWLAACNVSVPPLPTAVPLAYVPTVPPPTATSFLPPTLDLNAIQPTQAPTAVSTPRPTLTPTPVNTVLNVTEPKEGAVLMMGSEVEARGLLQKEADQTIWVDLVSANGRLLTTVPGTIGDIGWEANFTVPIFVSGAAYLQASVRDAAGEVVALNELKVTIVPDTENSDKYLVMFRPIEGDRAVENFNVFFDGRVFHPTNSTVRVSIWADNCQTQVTQQSFVLGAATGYIYWQAFAIPPRDSAGPGCAVATTGEPGEADWREAVIPITIYPRDDPEAKGIVIGNPPEGREVTAGEEILLYGTALNVSEGTVRVSLLLVENGQIVFDGQINTDFWGYWELPILLPFDVEGPAEITAFNEPEDQNDYAEYKTHIIIEPAPTPTPFAP